ncbi:hypothetical protein BDZ91DRAFT_745858 [Kalaharituber pfeilii]|nr:hypothetical protein BDZ91DRAFT_745858 [Kalaharituber pfeilii]
MPWCRDCDRYFHTQHSLQQHLDTAAVHQPVYYCEPCNKHFPDAHALDQHEENSIKHLRRVWEYVCEQCKWGCDTEDEMDDHDEDCHFYCRVHKLHFDNENNLRQHLASKAHGVNRQCPACRCRFPTITAVTLHMEAGTCAGGYNRHKVDRKIHEADRKGIITNRKLIDYGNWQPEPDVWATENAWNGYAYECYFCDSEYPTLSKLNGHITRRHAEKRTEKLYHCPCGKQFKYFSALMGHVEFGNCGVKEDRRLKGMFNGKALTY